MPQMNGDVKVDFSEMEKKLKFYMDRGRVAGATEVRGGSGSRSNLMHL